MVWAHFDKKQAILQNLEDLPPNFVEKSKSFKNTWGIIIPPSMLLASRHLPTLYCGCTFWCSGQQHLLGTLIMISVCFYSAVTINTLLLPPWLLIARLWWQFPGDLWPGWWIPEVWGGQGMTTEGRPGTAKLGNIASSGIVSEGDAAERCWKWKVVGDKQRRMKIDWMKEKGWGRKKGVKGRLTEKR